MKKEEPPTKTGNGVKKSVQIIVFAPVNSKDLNEDDYIYMVCPSSLKVVEVVEKFDDDAQQYLKILSKTKEKHNVDASKVEDTLNIPVDTTDIEIEIADTNDFSNAVKDDLENDDNATHVSEELDQDIEIFADQGLSDIFPDDNSDSFDSSVSDIDMADALALLDEEEEPDPEHFDDFIGKGDDDGDEMVIPSL